MSTRSATQARRMAARAAGALLLCAWGAAAGAEPDGGIIGSYSLADVWPMQASRWTLGVVAEPPRSVPPWSFGQESRYATPASLMVGMNLGPTANARLVLYAPLTPQRSNTLAADYLQDGQSVDPNGVPLPTPLRVGLVLTPSDPWADLRQGALGKMQLSGHMALSLRSKSGGVWLALNGRW